MAYDFKDKIALVTGGGSGIGGAVARQLGESGAKVVVADRDAEAAEVVVTGIVKAGGAAVSYEVDVADALEVETMVGFATQTYGGLHLAVNNAGIGGVRAPTADYPIDNWHHLINTNLSSAFYCMKHEIPAMLASGGGAIVNMASIMGTLGVANAPAYVAAKHGMVGLTKATALDYAKLGIRVNAVGPGYIETPLLSKSLDAAGLNHAAGLHPVGRLGTADEVAALTLFLLSDEASFITGSYHLVDGGYAAQ